MSKRNRTPKEQSYTDEQLEALDPYARDPEFRAHGRHADPRGRPDVVSHDVKDLRRAARSPEYWLQAAAFGDAPARPGHLVEWYDAYRQMLEDIGQKRDRRRKCKVAGDDDSAMMPPNQN